MDTKSLCAKQNYLQYDGIGATNCMYGRGKNIIIYILPFLYSKPSIC